jgi:hypothetical protein
VKQVQPGSPVEQALRLRGASAETCSRISFSAAACRSAAASVRNGGAARRPYVGISSAVWTADDADGEHVRNW